MLFIRTKTWREIRDQFTVEERQAVVSTIREIVVMPSEGWDLDVDRLEAELREKLLAAVLDHCCAVKK